MMGCETGEKIQELSEYFRSTGTVVDVIRNPLKIIFIPIEHFLPWGDIVAEWQGAKRGKLRWGDSLHVYWPRGLMETGQAVFKKAFPAISWYGVERNWMHE